MISNYSDNKYINTIYDNINPSYLKIQNKKKFLKNRNFFFKFHLKIDPSYIQGKEVLDLGSGSGFNSLYFLENGAKCTLVDNNLNSIKNAKKFLKKFKKLKFIHSDIRNLKFKKKFDIIHSKGVFHHNFNQKQLINKYLPLLKKNGKFIYSVATTNDLFLRNFQKYILYKISKKNNDIFKNAKLLFINHLVRAKKNGLRDIDSIINDTYINEIYHTLTSKEIIKIFEKKNYTMYSSFPNIFSINEILNPKLTFSKKDIKNEDYKFSDKFILNDLFFIKKKDKLNLIKNKKFFLKLENSILEFTNYFNKLDKKKKITKSQVINKIKKINNQLNKNYLFKTDDFTSIVNKRKLILNIINELERKKINLKKLKLLCSKLFGDEDNNGSGINYFVFIKDAFS
jgi:SAM-dependent methyltransferase